VVLAGTDVSEERISSIFRVIYLDSHWFPAKIYHTMDGEESLLQR
jgi:hypothetical protein